MKEPKYVIVIGASAGGLQAVTELMAQVNEEMDAAILVVLHTPHSAYSDVVVRRLERTTAFHCKLAGHGEVIRSNHLYLAIPDHHLILKKGKIILRRGPVEGRWRPSIAVLFRSAAVAYNNRYTGTRHALKHGMAVSF
jgi:two-component system chemotaxis response regulator CheB